MLILHGISIFLTNFVLFWQKISKFAGNQQFFYHFGHLSQKDNQFRRKTAVFLPFWSSFPERLPNSQEISIFLPFRSSFPERLPISQEISDFLTILVIFPRKITKFAVKRQFFYHFGHLSQKDYQFHRKSAIFLPISYCFGKTIPNSYYF